MEFGLRVYLGRVEELQEVSKYKHGTKNKWDKEGWGMWSGTTRREAEQERRNTVKEQVRCG
jgi:hypothetical protein